MALYPAPSQGMNPTSVPNTYAVNVAVAQALKLLCSVFSNAVRLFTEMVPNAAKATLLRQSVTILLLKAPSILMVACL